MTATTAPATSPRLPPAPRNDSSPISEHTCAGAPNTAIDDKPPLRSNSSSAEFTYEAPTATSYECRLDATVFSACPLGGPKEYAGLSDGSHTFQVRGVNASGPDPTPAAYTWTVDTTPPVAAIDTHPTDPSPGATAQFTYHAPNESGSSFECSLDGAPFAGCPAGGISYSGLGNGPHAFRVRAIDPTDNIDPTPAGYSFEVVLPLSRLPVQLSPAPPPSAAPSSRIKPAVPKTTLAGKPAAKTHDRTPTFRFQSTTRGVDFQCKLDRGRYRSCHSPFTTAPLSPGRHTFKVRAVAKGSADATPATASFRVVSR
jgi:hypothetical protein